MRFGRAREGGGDANWWGWRFETFGVRRCNPSPSSHLEIFHNFFNGLPVVEGKEDIEDIVDSPDFETLAYIRLPIFPQPTASLLHIYF